jgi:hypothetical protein
LSLCMTQQHLFPSSSSSSSSCIGQAFDCLTQTHMEHGNVSVAFRCLEQSLDTTDGGGVTEYRIQLATQLRQLTSSCKGTSGRITPFTLRESVSVEDPSVWKSREKDMVDPVCAECGKGQGTNNNRHPQQQQDTTTNDVLPIIHIASCCGLVCYCNTSCQKKHWIRVHRYTCLFLPPQQQRRTIPTNQK